MTPYTCNGPYSLLVHTSYFNSCSIHARFASVPCIDCKWCWGYRHFWTYRISTFCIKTIELITRKVINALYILMYCYTRISFVVLREGWVCTQVYLQEICSDAHERSGTNKLIWEYGIGYSNCLNPLVNCCSRHSIQKW